MSQQPDTKGHFGVFGGRYVAETLMPVLQEVDAAYREAAADAAFMGEFHAMLKTYVGRPSPLYFARRLTEAWGGADVYLKREDLNHTGAHKINNTLGQALLAKRMGKTKLMAETGAGQHGVATATVAALLGMSCKVYMGEEDIVRQAPNVKRMELLGAEVVPVTSGTRTLKDAMSEALRAWVAEVEDTFYVIGSVAGPHPYPMMVRDFQRIIGDEARLQFDAAVGGKPDAVVACVGGGSNAAGIFCGFVGDANVRLIGVEAGGYGLDSGKHAASIIAGQLGILHGSKSYVLQDENGQIQNAHSVSAGLDYPGVGPEHALWADEGRAEYHAITDDEALDAFHELTRLEGILPALESAHAIAEGKKMAAELGAGKSIIVNLSGRGDKDLDSVLKIMGKSDE
ncbi:MAG: tryptophan synthase subunit beta [Verrucomicrobia bacterium]|jgi:tryptophan synthase beta chain|nr:tryptophan synthase subunit beta [Verrucomicrobiota bacterium]